MAHDGWLWQHWQMSKRSLVQEYVAKHAAGGYGDTGHKSLPAVLPHVLALKPKSLIDFGAGRNDIAMRLGRLARIPDTVSYDPAVPGRDVFPLRQFDVLVSIDMFEHIPDEEIDGLAKEMALLAEHAILSIDTGPAKALLSDGRNAHVSIHPGEWWLKRLRAAWPSLRPIEAYRKRRAAFKTWDAELSSLHRWFIINREIVIRKQRNRQRSEGRWKPRLL